MLALLKHISNFFSINFYNSVLSEEEASAILDDLRADEEEKLVESSEKANANICFNSKGKITYLEGHHGIIDNDLFFDEYTLTNLKVGLEVNYLAYKVDGIVKVSKILSVVDENWSEDIKEPESFWYKKNTITQVIGREGRIIYMDSEITCDLNKVQSEFIPIVGDWVQLETLVEADKTKINYSGTVLNVEKIIPLGLKIIEGVIKVWDCEALEGQINSDVFLNGDSLNPGYMPVHNDKVIAEIIESQQGKCTKRAVKVIPNGTYNTKNCVKRKDNTKNLVRDKNGIVISDGTVINLKSVYDSAQFEIEVWNKSKQTHKLHRYGFKSVETQSQLNLLSPTDEDKIILPEQKIIFKFSCIAKFMGTTQELFLFTFEDFEIGRWITIKVMPELTQNIRNYASKNQKNIIDLASESMLCDNKDIVLGQKPIKPPSFIVNKLPVYEIPSKLTAAVFKQMDKFRCLTDIPIESIAPYLKFDLNYMNYEDRFHALLYLEEIALQINMHKYDMERACFVKVDDFLILEVDDLSERKPSVIIGDRVIASDPSSPKGKKFEGFVHKISSTHVYIKFHPNFHDNYDKNDYMVEFHFSRSSFRRYHQAVHLAFRFLGHSFLFPTRLVTRDVQLIFQEDSNRVVVVSKKKNLLSKNKSALECNDKNELSASAKCKESSDNDCDVFYDANSYSNEFSKYDVKSNSKLSVVSNDMREKSNSILLQPMINMKITFPNVERRKYRRGIDLKYLTKTCPVKLQWFNKNLNHHQKEAVKNILRGEARPLPYIIFGPPGTGKTITLIEAALQLLRLLPHSRLLITAPSNSAADLLAMRLLNSGVLLPGDLVRMVAFRCVSESSIPEALRPFCVTADIAKEGSQEQRGNKENGVIVGQYASALGRHRITVGTCMIVGSFYTMGFPRGHFTHVLIDEAGQATEPEAMIPLSLMNTNQCQIILAGDPRQLGPCVFSLLSSTYGLSQSFLERLICRFPYAKDIIGFPNSGGYDPRLVTKLVLSYRSLPDILALPNMLFYKSELISMVSIDNSAEAALLKRLNGFLPRVPGPPPSVIFHGVRGINYQMADSPSWFNSAEASQVFFYVNELYNRGISSEEIGIISPYVKQCQQVKALLVEGGLQVPKVGSVEEFQGQEFMVVIVTTVRSNESSARRDSKLELGFIASPRRVNVAISRAQALLIIVGNPHLLSVDSTWRSVLMYAIKIGGYTGCDLPNL